MRAGSNDRRKMQDALYRAKQLHAHFNQARKARSLTYKMWDEMFEDERQCWVHLGTVAGITEEVKEDGKDDE